MKDVTKSENKGKTIWRNRKKILEGIWYNHVVFFFNKKHWAKREVEHRRNICDTCPYLDRIGRGNNVILKGQPACSFCGCNIKEKTACLSCECAHIEPKWKAISIKNEHLIEEWLNS